MLLIMAVLGQKNTGISGSPALGSIGINVWADGGTVSNYLRAGRIVDATEIAAVNQFYLDMIGEGSTTNNSNLLPEFYGIYLVSPTSLVAAAVNFVDATSGTYYNSPTHATTGVTGNGTTQYFDTEINLFDVATLNDAGLTLSSTFGNNSYPIGATGTYDAISSRFAFRHFSSKKRWYAGQLGTHAQVATTSRNITTGVRRAANDRENYLNGVSSSTNTSNDSATQLPDMNVLVMGMSNNGSPGSYFAGEYDFAAIHSGLTDNQARDLADAIITYNANVISGGR